MTDAQKTHLVFLYILKQGEMKGNAHHKKTNLLLKSGRFTIKNSTVIKRRSVEGRKMPP